MRRGSVNDYAEAMRKRYRIDDKAERGRLLDEFTATTGHHRKSAMRPTEAPRTNRTRR